MAARLRNRLGLAMVLVLAACAGPAGKDGAKGPEPEVPSRVRVANNGFADVNVFLLQGGTRFRLGTVTGMTNQTFRLPRQVARSHREVRIVADPIGGTRGYVSERVMLSPGTDLDVRVNASLQLSSVSVW